MSGRRLNDHYGASPESWATNQLLRRLRLRPRTRVLEPCSGRGFIAEVLKAHKLDVVTNDIDRSMPSLVHYDARDPELYVGVHPQWIITNPPFNQAAILVPRFFDEATVGIAIMLRYSWQEPTGDRWRFLVEHPRSAQYDLPRMSFTGDGHTDSISCAWYVWLKAGGIHHPAFETFTPWSDQARFEELA